MDLPPETRNRIYEITMHRPKQPVCVRDRLLRPSDTLPDAKLVHQQCSSKITCSPCQIHDLLGTSSLGLSRACKQLHSETSLSPYTVNTFNVHNLYYLQASLSVIGEKGRQSLRSLKLYWRLSEEEAQPLIVYTSVKMPYVLLGECRSLLDLSVEIHVVKMLHKAGDGKRRPQMLNYLNEIPYVHRVFELRGLKMISIEWRACEGLIGMD